MAEQSATEPEEALKEQGEATREQQRRIANGQENTKGTKAPLRGETLAQAAKRYPKPGPGGAGGMSTGHREIQRGANDESEHRKRRGDG
jgi:hypothetical protein